MVDRDCDNCAYARPTHTMDNGCTAWECEYIPRTEAIKAWKELHKRTADTPQAEIKTGCSRCEAKWWCRDADSEVARWCNNYNKDTQTDCGWK